WWRRNYSKNPSDSKVEVLYSKTKSHSESLARQFVNEPVLGFHMEWPWDAYIRPRLQDKIGLIQLAKEGKVALFHISLHEGDTVADLITPTLKEIIESSKIKKAGVNIMSADFSRLRAYFDLEPKGAFELSHLYNLVTYGAHAPHMVTTRIRQLSMQAEEHLGLSLLKGSVRTSDWSQPLNQNQIQYAAIDAYACFMLFHRMNAKRLAIDPVPPLPRLAETYLRSTSSKSSILQLESSTEDGRVEIITATDFFGPMKDREQNGKITEGPPSIKHDDTDSQSNILDDMQGDVGDDVKDSLYGKLVSHRKELAKSQSVPVYVIAPNKTLEDLALQRPSNKEELLLVHGIGEVKAAQFGPAWLDIIAEF
ncbi:ribonuclease H-like domain-containing protein, partial [Xylaria flabelliformis]